MADVDETVVEDVSPQDEDEVVPFTYAITAYGADYPVDGLVKRLDQGDIVVPDFQRGFVWSRPQSDRFVESLLLGLPVPGIFLAIESESRRLLVVDGQQRLTTLSRFYDGLWEGNAFALKGVQPQYRGKTYGTLEPEQRRRLDDSILHATVVKQNEPSEDQSSIYFLFERLNTGGTPLQPQEIRNSIYRGEFRDLLEVLSGIPEWREVYGPESPRLKDRELILRFFAMKYMDPKYTRPMKGFLNTFMARNRHLRGRSAMAGLIISSSPPSVARAVREMNELKRKLPADVLRVIEDHEARSFFDCPEYTAAIMVFYKRHLCRMDAWPEGVEVALGPGFGSGPYLTMWGPSEFGPVIGNLDGWDITDRLHEIRAPTLVTGGRHDEMWPEHMAVLADGLPDAELVIFENSSHMAFVEERELYVATVRRFLDRVERADV